MSTWPRQVSLFISENSEYIIAGFVVLTLFGGFLTFESYLSPGTEVERTEEASWSSTAEFTNQATVVNQTAVFDEGDVLTNRSVYFESVTPTLDSTFRYEYEATAGGELNTATELSLILRSVDQNVEYWRTETELETVSNESVQPGEQLTVPFSINITQLNEQIGEIESQLSGSPGNTEIIVESQVELEGTRNNLQIAEEKQYQMQIDTQGNVYRVTNGGPVTDSGQQFAQETSQNRYGPLWTVGGPVLLFVSVLGIGGIVIGRREGTFEISDRERTWMKYRAARSEFEEWISHGTLPADVDERTVVEVDSLEDLVDVAIDSNRRVVADQSRNDYVVILEETIYRFTAPPSPGKA
jgi:hypothetical protein